MIWLMGIVTFAAAIPLKREGVSTSVAAALANALTMTTTSPDMVQKGLIATKATVGRSTAAANSCDEAFANTPYTNGPVSDVTRS